MNTGIKIILENILICGDKDQDTYSVRCHKVAIYFQIVQKNYIYTDK